MLADYRPLLRKDLGVRTDQVRVRRFSVHHHEPEVDWVRAHRHDFAQYLLYLSGSGQQRIEKEAYPVSSGVLIHVAPGVRHAFEKGRSRRPVCLVLDYEVERQALAVAPTSQACSLAREAFHLVQHRLSTMMGEGEDGEIHSRAHAVREAGMILEILGVFMEALGGERSRGGMLGAGPLSTKVKRLLEGADLASLTTLGIAQELGLQRDHLNRGLRRECGLTSGQLLADARLRFAKERLRDGAEEIQEVAYRSGFADRNYFARWFKKQTGQTPSDWRAESLAR